VTVEACARLVERGDPDRFRAAMAAPPHARALLFPLYAFNLEVARAPWVTREPLLARVRLQWWREALTEPRAHEVATPLREAIARGVSVAPLEALIDARERDVEGGTFADGAELRAYLEGTAGNLLWAGAAGLGEPEALRAPAMGAGFAGGLAAFLLALPELRARGRDPGDVDLRALAAEALDVLGKARRAPFGPGVPALRAQWWAAGVLGRAAAGRADLAPSEAGKRLSLAWRAARGAW
jgi:phytoene/squalene synthetase